MLAVVHPLPDPARRRTRTPGDAAPAVRSVTDALGRRIAWSAAGCGSPSVVAVSGWPTHLLAGWRDPVFGAYLRGLCADRRLVRYDRPGVGIAERVPEHRFENDVAALEAVLAVCGEDRVALFAAGIAGPVAIAVAARWPELVSHLVLFGTAARPLADGVLGGGLTPAVAAALEQLIAADWDLASRTLADLMLPDGDQPTVAALAAHLRTAASARSMAAMLRGLQDVDVSALLPRIAVPTLVLHRRDDRTIPVRAAQLLAARIPGARLEILDGSEHLPAHGDVPTVHAALDRFLSPAAGRLTARELDVLRRVAEGLTNQQAGRALGVSAATVARHLANVFLKLDVATRGAAVARARRSGLL